MPGSKLNCKIIWNAGVLLKPYFRSKLPSSHLVVVHVVSTLTKNTLVKPLFQSITIWLIFRPFQHEGVRIGQGL